MVGTYIRIGIRLIMLFFRLGVRVVVLLFERKKAVRVFRKAAMENGLSSEQALKLSDAIPKLRILKPR